ncbi:MAG: nitroreductase family protein [Candidatus Pacearchaeota archaeon]
MNLDKAIQGRRSVRKFKDKKPDWREIIECIDAARFAPMAGGNYSLKFILIDDSKKINKIAESCQQDFITQAHYIVVACSNPSRTKNAYEEKGETYVRQQAGAAIQNFLLKITDSGLSTCWVGHFIEEQIKKELKIPEGINIEAILPIGFEYEKKKSRKAPIELDNILYFNEYKNTKMNRPKKLSV